MSSTGFAGAMWCLRSLVAIEGAQAPLWQGGTTRRSHSYGKEFQTMSRADACGAE